MHVNKLVRIGCFALLAALPSGVVAHCPGSDPTMSGSRPDYYSVRHEFSRAKFVIEAIAIRETWLGLDGKPKPLKGPFHFGSERPASGIYDPYMGAYFDVRIRRTFKGRPAPQLRLFSENSTARFFLRPGRTYLLFVTDEAFDPPVRRALTVDNCGNSDAASKRSLVREVERLSHP